jgi:RNA polymerase sigma factor (sigma-70 family)
MHKKVVTDEELINSYLGGEENCLRTLIQRHQSRIFTSIYVLVKDRCLAEDLFQETFIKVINSLRAGRYEEKGKFAAWVVQIATNLVRDYYRKMERLPKIVGTEGENFLRYIPLMEDSGERKMIIEETNEMVKGLIQKLPNEQREVLMMRHYAKLSFKEIADLTGVSTNTALARMRYALGNMRKMIEKHNITL